jgi:hypothetical protein
MYVSQKWSTRRRVVSRSACVRAGFSAIHEAPSGALLIMKHAENAQHALVSPRCEPRCATRESLASELGAHNRAGNPKTGCQTVYGVEHFMTWIREGCARLKAVFYPRLAKVTGMSA